MHPREPAGEQDSDPSPATRRALVSQHPCLSNWNSLSTCLLCSSGWTVLSFCLGFPRLASFGEPGEPQAPWSMRDFMV